MEIHVKKSNNNKNQSSNNLKLSGRNFNADIRSELFMQHDEGYQEKPEEKIHNPKPNASQDYNKTKF